MTTTMRYWTDGNGRPITDDNGDPIPRPNPALLRKGTTIRKTTPDGADPGTDEDPQPSHPDA